VGEKLKALTNAEIGLVCGSGGVFDVTIDGELRFSKHQRGRFPTDAELGAIAKP
jgi:predicted Rdx family selenoprotein